MRVLYARSDRICKIIFEQHRPPARPRRNQAGIRRQPLPLYRLYKNTEGRSNSSSKSANVQGPLKHDHLQPILYSACGRLLFPDEPNKSPSSMEGVASYCLSGKNHSKLRDKGCGSGTWLSSRRIKKGTQWQLCENSDE